jgi:hypothetical protein
MPQEQALENQIAELERLVNSAASNITTDGTHVTFDLALAERRLAILKRRAAGKTGPEFATIRLDGGFSE